MDITAHGEEQLMSRCMCREIPNTQLAKYYYHDVFADYYELRHQYPFSKMIIPPTTKPREVKIVVVAVEKDLIEELKATPEDFTAEYSKLIEVIIPFNYRAVGCDVYGGEWIDINALRPDERHMHGQMKDGRYKLCLGTPTSFIELKNVILECVRTADNYLVAYEKYQRGLSKRLELLAYAHGDIGKKQHDEDKKRYRTKESRGK